MEKAKFLATKYANPTTLRIIYVLLALLAMALGGGAPDEYSGGGGG